MTSSVVYSTKLREAITALRPAFRELSHGLHGLTQKRAAIAPSFMRAYTLWRRETRRPFVAFVQALDSSVPASRDAYRTHPSYYAAQYLQQLATQPDKKTSRGRTPMAMLAITIKSFLPLYGPNQKDQENAIKVLLGATKWRDRDIARLHSLIKRARPVALPNVPRLVESVKTTNAAIIAFERERLAS